MVVVAVAVVVIELYGAVIKFKLNRTCPANIERIAII